MTTAYKYYQTLAQQLLNVLPLLSPHCHELRVVQSVGVGLNPPPQDLPLVELKL